MLRDFTFTAAPADAGQRLDRVIRAHCPTATRAAVLAAIEARHVRLNDRPAAKGARVAAGDHIHVAELLEIPDRRVQPNPALPLAICYTDDTLLVLDKPAGMPVHPLDPAETGTLANALIAHEPALAAIGPDPLFPALVHRLDTDTSGLVLAARTPAAYDQLREAFRRHTVTKEYLALVHGAPPDRLRLEHLLAHTAARPAKMRVYAARPPAYDGPRLMRAVTDGVAIQRLRGFTLLRVTIPTGVTHQIRAQLAAAGHPLAGDCLYGPPPDPPPPDHRSPQPVLRPPRHFLHAAVLAFTHPATSQTLRVESPLPAELQAVLAGLAETPNVER